MHAELGRDGLVVAVSRRRIVIFRAFGERIEEVVGFCIHKILGFRLEGIQQRAAHRRREDKAVRRRLASACGLDR